VAKQIQDEDSAPAWLTTMSDMNNLLMVFFVLLFSMLTRDKMKYLKLEEDLQAMSMSGRVSRQSAAKDVSGESAAKAFEALAAKQVAQTEIHQIQGHYVRLQRLQEGVALTLGSEPDPFDEGGWTLKPSHRTVLATVKKYLAGTHKIIEVRGHTSGHPLDSVIVETGSEGQVRVRKFTPADRGPDELQKANWYMLAMLRANEVKNYLIRKHPDEGDLIELKEHHIRVRADAFTRFLTPGSDAEKPEERAVNHRVEIVLTHEDVRKR